MAYCPNCGANVGFSKVCPHCGQILGPQSQEKKVEQSSNKSEIERLKEVTNNFSQKPSCSDDEFKALVVKALATASIGEKALYEERIKAYSDNYLNGGSSIVNNPVKTEYARSGSEASDLSAGSTSSSSSRSRRSFNKKPLIIALACVLGVGVLAGAGIGIAKIIENKKWEESSTSVRKTKVYLYYNYPDYDYGEYETTYIEYNSTKSLDSKYIPSRSGYVFTGFYDSPSTDYGEKYFDQNGDPMDKWSIKDSSFSLYAHWESEGETYWGYNVDGLPRYGYISSFNSSRHMKLVPAYSGASYGTYQTGLNSRYSGSYSGTETMYLQDTSYSNYSYGSQSSDKNLFWTTYGVNSSNMGTDTFVMLNKKICEYSYTFRYLAWSSPSSFDYNVSGYTASCCVILAQLSYSSGTFTYLFANNRIYSDVSISYSAYSFDSLTTDSTLTIYVNGSTVLRNY